MTVGECHDAMPTGDANGMDPVGGGFPTISGRARVDRNTDGMTVTERIAQFRSAWADRRGDYEYEAQGAAHGAWQRLTAEISFAATCDVETGLLWRIAATRIGDVQQLAADVAFKRLRVTADDAVAIRGCQTSAETLAARWANRHAWWVGRLAAEGGSAELDAKLLWSRACSDVKKLVRAGLPADDLWLYLAGEADAIRVTVAASVDRAVAS